MSKYNWAYKIDKDTFPEGLVLTSSRRRIVAHPIDIKDIEEIFREGILNCIGDGSDCQNDVSIDGQNVEIYTNRHGGTANRSAVFFEVMLPNKKTRVYRGEMSTPIGFWAENIAPLRREL